AARPDSKGLHKDVSYRGRPSSGHWPAPGLSRPSGRRFQGETPLIQQDRLLVSGNEAIALAALHEGVAMGTGYPGTPSTEILEYFSGWGRHALWAPTGKVALAVGIGAAYAGARAVVTMTHVGVNVAADPLFTVAYTGVTGALILISADDPGMASSQNEQ